MVICMKVKILSGIIFVCKYRKQLLIKLGDEIKNIMYDIAERYNFKILEMEVDKEYQIYYKQPCADELVFTGIKVIKKEATEKQAETQEENKDNSSTKASSLMIIIVCGLLLLSF